MQSFDFSRYGGVEGTVDFLTATTFLDEKNKPYYRGRIILSQHHVGGFSQNNKILPGMTVDVGIITGEKTILSYLLKPIQRAVQTALTER